MLRILRAMQFLTVLIERAPGQVAIDCEQLAQVLAHGIESIQATHRASLNDQKQLEGRIAKLPEEIARGISAEAIAAKLSESLRQQFQQTGLPAVADAIGVQATTLRDASKALSAALDEFATPENWRSAARQRCAPLGERRPAECRGSYSHADKRTGERIITDYCDPCLGAMVIGLLASILYQRWMDAPLSKAAQANAPGQQ